MEGEFVAVERLAFEGEEDASLRTVTTVGRDARMLLIELVEFLDIHHYIYDLLMYYLRFWCKDSEICSLRTLRTRKKIKICVLCVLRG